MKDDWHCAEETCHPRLGVASGLANGPVDLCSEQGAKRRRGSLEHMPIIDENSMETLVIICAIAAGIIGIAGSILPGLPGTPFSWVGMLILYLWGSGTNAAGDPMSLNTLIIWGVVVVVVSVIDYVVPMYFTKITGGSRYAEKGALIGLVAGIILTPIGMIAGSFLGAFLAELLWAKKTPEESLKAAFGSFLGFMLGTGIKTIAACLIMWQIIVYAF